MEHLLWDTADIIAKVRPPEVSETARLKPGKTLITFFYPAQNNDLLEQARGTVLSQTHTKDLIGSEAGCSGSEDLELFGDRRPGIVGIPRLSFAHHMHHLDTGQDDGGADLRLEASMDRIRRLIRR